MTGIVQRMISSGRYMRIMPLMNRGSGVGFYQAVLSDLSSDSMVREVYSESGRAVLHSAIPNLSGTSVLESHSCASVSCPARHFQAIRQRRRE